LTKPEAVVPSNPASSTNADLTPALPLSSAITEALNRSDDIRGKLAAVQEAARNGELSVLNREHHASWDDIEFLLDTVALLRRCQEEITAYEALQERLSALSEEMRKQVRSRVSREHLDDVSVGASDATERWLVKLDALCLESGRRQEEEKT
jgi:hypothetical protein